MSVQTLSKIHLHVFDDIFRTQSAQLKHPRAQMCTLLDRSSVIFKFPSLRFNFYQASPPRGGQPVAPNIFLRSFFPPSMALTRLPSVRIFLSLKLGVGSPNSALPTRAVITKQNHTGPGRFFATNILTSLNVHTLFLFPFIYL